MEPVLKTGIGRKLYRGFESHPHRFVRDTFVVPIVRYTAGHGKVDEDNGLLD